MLSSSRLFASHRDHLLLLERQTRLRSLAARSGKDFSSNDYLGLAGSSELANAVRGALERGVPTGSGGSRLLRGNHEEHEALEAEAAALFGAESAIYFSAGFCANSSIISTLPQRGDLIIADELIHASAHEGLKLSRADHLFARHNDAGHVEELARGFRAKSASARIWLALESLYSMDGDRAPLDDLAQIADATDAILIVDEAHAAGVFGEKGLGLAEHLQGRENLIRLVTCGKAIGCEGALILGPQLVKDFLVNRSRAFIFSTAPSPLMASAVRASLKLIQSEPQRRQHLRAIIQEAENGMSKLGLKASGSQILPIILKSESMTMNVAASLRQRGFDVRGVRPPSVPQGSSRLRISITLNVTKSDTGSLFSNLAQVLSEA